MNRSTDLLVIPLTEILELFSEYDADKTFINTVKVTLSRFELEIYNARLFLPPSEFQRTIHIALPIGLCKNIEQIAAISDVDIKDSCHILDTIEKIALAHYDSKNLTNEEKLKHAFNARIKFYHRFFVDHGAKHKGDHVLVTACDYLRSLRLNKHERSAHKRQNQVTLETMLRTIGATESYVRGFASYSFCSVDDKPAYTLKNPNKMRDLGCRLYKAIQGRKIIQQLTSQRGKSIAIGTHKVIVTDALIRLLPFASAAISKARDWETRAYTSCLGSSNDGGSHDFERDTAALLATIDFESDPNVIFAEIESLYRQGILKKYLKYKEKYLNLKKQLNLL